MINKIIYLKWNNINILEQFPKEDFYLIINCVRLSKNININDALDLSNYEKYRELEKNYTNSR